MPPVQPGWGSALPSVRAHGPAELSPGPLHPRAVVGNITSRHRTPGSKKDKHSPPAFVPCLFSFRVTRVPLVACIPCFNARCVEAPDASKASLTGEQERGWAKRSRCRGHLVAGLLAAVCAGRGRRLARRPAVLWQCTRLKNRA